MIIDFEDLKTKHNITWLIFSNLDSCVYREDYFNTRFEFNLRNFTTLKAVTIKNIDHPHHREVIYSPQAFS